MIEHIAVKGYRLFRDFQTDLQPGINVLIGANASGKSTLVELLRIIQSCCEGSVRSGIEPRPSPGQVFHREGELSIAWGITIALSQTRDGRGLARCHHAMEIEAPAARPHITGEALTMLLRKAPAKRSGALAYPEELRASGLFEPPPPYRVLFTAQNGRGVIAEGKSRYSLDLGPAEPMLSRATDPRQRNSCRFRDTILRWSFYSALHVDRVAPLRQSQPAEGTTYLEESGRNLTPVLLSLFTNLDYEEQRDELLGFLRTALPQFRTLTPTPEPVSNNVVLQWVERDVSAKFSASDLSDGYLRLLCLAVICCNPHPPRLICIDEPEVGLHPLVLPLVGGLLRRAAQRSQVIVLTHSPDLLYGMPIESIGVMRRADGEAQIVWPKDVKLLCNLVSREVAGERELDPDRLRQAFSSGELDTLG